MNRFNRLPLPSAPLAEGVPPGRRGAGEPTPTIAELISFIRVCEEQIGTEGYSRPRLRAVLAILEAEAERRKRRRR